jgi:GTP-binding protein Era
MSFRSGSVALLGKPNVGKSTLLNALVGSKVAIVSPKPQTTRVQVRGILTREKAQIVFVDTPGAHKPMSRLNREMMSAVRAGLEGVDLFYLVIDATRKPGEEDKIALRLATETKTPGFLVLNKMDLVRRDQLLPLIDSYRQQYEFADYIPVSARTKENLPLLEEKTLERLSEGEPLFSEEEFTDQPARFMAAEIIREKIFRETHQEIPYNTAVAIEKFEEEGGLTRIYATVLVERAGQKGIVIGAKGQMAKKIGRVAREEIEQLLGCKVYLELFVKVKENWQEHAGVRRLIDWREPGMS